MKLPEVHALHIAEEEEEHTKEMKNVYDANGDGNNLSNMLNDVDVSIVHS